MNKAKPIVALALRAVAGVFALSVASVVMQSRE